MTAARLIGVELDPDSLAATTPDAEHERQIAIFDLLEDNSFDVPGYGEGGPYHLNLSAPGGKLAFDIRDEQHEPVHAFILSLAPFRSIIRDYFIICESYYDAIRHKAPHQIEAIDMARRGIHNDGSELLAERLKGKVDISFETARRLFTLICALQTNQRPL